MTEELRVAVAVPPEDLAELAQFAADNDVVQEPIDEATAERLEIGVLAAVLLIGAGLAVYRVVADMWERWQGGLVIDLTKQPVKISRNPDVPRGFIVTVTKDGKVDIEVKDEPKDAIERLTEAVLKLPVDATVDAAKAVIDKVLGRDTATTTTTTPSTETG